MEATSASSSLVNDVAEEILLRLPVKSLFRFKSVSKKWRCMIESRSFAERHLKIAERSHVENPKVMAIISTERNAYHLDTDLCFKTICSESASLLSSTIVNFPQGFDHWINVSESCDGLFCIHSYRLQSIYVVNPATRWLRQLPPARFQILMHKFTPMIGQVLEPFHMIAIKSVSHLAFVKADDYKLVWLYNSDKYNSDASSPNEGLTNCEVFDFRANAWRYLTCTPSYRLYYKQRPASANGSVYWFTEPYNGEIKLVALDIHTETFRVLPKINPVIASSDPDHIGMCALDNGLFMWKREPETMVEYIWRLKPSQDTWENIYTIDLLSSNPRWLYDTPNRTVLVAVCKKEKILLNFRYGKDLMKYDPQTKSFSPIFKDSCIKYVPYFQSLISHI
ncbi:unnamed protein product [Microthlaspi erraticum]|uniref:F-box domain-containing protein n=1 Tax=Microthlaspi erraticum TaxID=1685480 RepID=A0A6D2JHL2_9BRAS|nr:unnamed protein product [Microthlaspi erraticum]